MKLKIDKEVDVVRIRFTDSRIEESDEIKPGIICDYDADGKLVGMEFLDATEVFGDLTKLANATHRTKAINKPDATARPRHETLLPA